MLNNHKKGYYRDSELLNLLNSQSVLNTEQIRILLFKDTCLRIVQRRLKKLSEAKRIKRGRASIDEPFYYYLDKKPGQLEHSLGVSWIYTWIMSTLSNMETIHKFEREVDYKILRSDAFLAINNTWSKQFAFFFFEFDNDSSNAFDKVEKYNRIYSEEMYLGRWWVPLSKRFPMIIIVTTGSKKTIEEKIEMENVNKLRFKVYSLNEIKEECRYGSSRSRSVRTV